MKKFLCMLAVLLAFMLVPSGDLVSLDTPWDQGPGDGDGGGDDDDDGDDHPWGGNSGGYKDDPRDGSVTAATGIAAVDIVYHIWIFAYSVEIKVIDDNSHVAELNQTIPTQPADANSDSKLSNGNRKDSK